jgi:type I restriction enzyme S subunit
MKASFPVIPLGEILSKSEEWIDLDPAQTYQQVTIKIWGHGVVQRNEVTGAEIAATRRFVVRPQQFILSRIDARNGALGIVPQALDGAVVSNDFPTFNLDTSRILPEYLGWMSKTHSFVELCKAASEGTTNRVRLQEDLFLSLQIPLPPLAEQRRIVARIEELAAKIEEARGLRRAAVEEAEAIFSAVMSQIWHNQSRWAIKYVSELASTVSGQVDPRIEPYASLPHINGEAMESGTGRLLSYRTAKEDEIISGKYHFLAGSVLYSKIRPYLRKSVQVPVEGICSADVYAFESISSELVPRFFMYSLIAPPFTDYANLLSGRTRMPKLNQDQLFGFQMGYPPLPEQRRIVAYLDSLQAKVDALKALQAETQAELNALLPSVLDKAFKGEL